MRIPSELVGAINTYYAFRRYFVDHSITGTNLSVSLSFKNSEQKDQCCKLVVDTAEKYGFSVVIPPGTIFLAKGNQSRQINGPLLTLKGCKLQ